MPGPVNIIVGSVPIEENAFILALGFKLSFLPISLLPIKTAALHQLYQKSYQQVYDLYYCFLDISLMQFHLSQNASYF